MEHKLKFQPEELSAFRSALSRKAGERKQGRGRIHALALRLGAWRKGGYAPFQGSRGPNTRRRREVASSGLPAFHMFKDGEARDWLVPDYLRKAFEARSHALAGRPLKLAVAEHAVWSARREAVGHSGRPIARPRPGLSGEVLRRRSFAPPAKGGFASSVRGGMAPDVRAISEAMRFGASVTELNQVEQGVELTAPSPKGRPVLSEAVAGGDGMVTPRGVAWPSHVRAEASRERSHYMAGADFADALDDYFFEQSRLAPRGGTGFDPRLSPLWAGLKLPG